MHCSIITSPYIQNTGPEREVTKLGDTHLSLEHYYFGHKLSPFSENLDVMAKFCWQNILGDQSASV